MPAFTRCFAVVLLVAACGSGSAAGPEPRSSAARADRERDEETSGPGGTEESNDAPESSSKPSGPSCDDGTCSLCGSGICPVGWYCDERASGGGACSWLAECAEKATCNCVTRVLGAGCKCREEGGGLKVACD